MDMEEKIRLITKLIDSLNMYRFLGGGDHANYFVTHAELGEDKRKVIVFFTDWEYRDALFLLLDCWDWCQTEVKDDTIVVTLFND